VFAQRVRNVWVGCAQRCGEHLPGRAPPRLTVLTERPARFGLLLLRVHCGHSAVST
jgi:hypothetical protein